MYIVDGIVYSDREYSNNIDKNKQESSAISTPISPGENSLDIVEQKTITTSFSIQKKNTLDRQSFKCPLCSYGVQKVYKLSELSKHLRRKHKKNQEQSLELVQKIKEGTIK